MKKSFLHILILIFGGVIIFTSCQKEYSCEGCRGDNKPPIANTGPDQTITLPTDSALLDGSSSSDPDGMISEWLWTKISGPASFSIVKPTDSLTKVKTLVVGTYQFELKLTDNAGLSAKDTLRVIVDSVFITNHPPIANAGADQTITLPLSMVNLDGSASTDLENNITGYVWTKISGPSSFSLANANGVQTQATNLLQGVYEFELKITDTGGLFSKDTVRIIVTVMAPDPCPSKPVINAQLVPFGTLSGPKAGVSVGAAGNKIVFAGGSDGSESVSTVDIYDIATNTWSTAQLSAPRSGMAVTTCGNKIFFGGGSYDDGVGFYLRKNVDIYDASTNMWSVDSLSSARNGLTAASVGNKVFFAGGTTPNYSVVYSNIVDIYDLTTNTWSTTTLSEARGYLSAVAVDNKIYFAGGENGYYSFSNRIDIYDDATSSWSVGRLDEPKARMASIAFGNKIYWAGGVNSLVASHWNQSSQVEIDDVYTQTSSFACLFQPNMWNPHGAAEMNGKLVFFMGYGSSGVINKFDIYDVVTNTWSIGVLNQNLFNTSIISVNKTIYVAGGVTAVIAGSWSSQVWKLEF